jgi:hypothetical protein
MPSGNRNNENNPAVHVFPEDIHRGQNSEPANPGEMLFSYHNCAENFLIRGNLPSFSLLELSLIYKRYIDGTTVSKNETRT